MTLDAIYNQTCEETIEMLKGNGVKVDCILTSPPYNMTKRKGGYADTGRYDVYQDWKPEDEYIDWTVQIFNGFHEILKENRVILYNFSYSIENPALPYKLVAAIAENTPFTLIDTIIWKKKAGLPFPANGHRLCRNWEFVWVFARKGEEDTYENNRRVKSVSEKTGQKYYEAIYNFVDAANNDGKCELNQATFSTELCEKLFDIYCKKGWVVYDPFIGTGTTAVAAKKCGLNFLGSEISKDQCEYAEERVVKNMEKEPDAKRIGDIKYIVDNGFGFYDVLTDNIGKARVREFESLGFIGTGYSPHGKTWACTNLARRYYKNVKYEDVLAEDENIEE